MMDIDQIVAEVGELITLYGLKIVAALVILFVGRWVAMGIRGVVKRLMSKAKVDATITKFVGNLPMSACWPL